MTETNVFEYDKILVISPHPYDIDLWASGTLRSFVASGKIVHTVICSDGSKTSRNAVLQGSNLKDLRKTEQINASNILGIQSVTFLDLVDGELEDNDQFRKLIVREIRKDKPDLVITSEPYRKFLPWHRDNRITGQVTLDAVYPYGRDHLHYQDLWENESLEPHNTRAIWFWGTENPNVTVNTEKFIDHKIEAMLCHETQIADQSKEELTTKLKSRAGNASSGSTLTEPFREVTFRV